MEGFTQPQEGHSRAEEILIEEVERVMDDVAPNEADTAALYLETPESFLDKGSDERAFGIPGAGFASLIGLELMGYLLLFAVILWATAKVSLVSARERRRERPGLPRALLSLLGVLVVGSGLTISISLLLDAYEAPSLPLRVLLIPSILAASLGAGLLAHRLAAAARDSRPRTQAPA
jgi:hypothetical protein